MSGSEATSRIHCLGIEIGRTRVPPFAAASGEIVKIVFPNDRDGHAAMMEAAVRMIVSDDHMIVEGEGPIVALESPLTRSAVREFFHRQTAAEFLTTRAGLARDEAIAQLQCVGVTHDAPIATLAGNPRWLIGFLVARACRPAAIVFRSTGLDPLGLQRALAVADERLDDATGIYLTCFPDPGVPEPSFAAVLHATRQPNTARVAS